MGSPAIAPKTTLPPRLDPLVMNVPELSLMEPRGIGFRFLGSGLGFRVWDSMGGVGNP